MVIDSINEYYIPKNVTSKEKSLWIFNKLERMEEALRNKLHTYAPLGLNKKGESNFRKWVLPKLTQPDCGNGTREPVLKDCTIMLHRLKEPSLCSGYSLQNQGLIVSQPDSVTIVANVPTKDCKLVLDKSEVSSFLLRSEMKLQKRPVRSKVANKRYNPDDWVLK